MTSENVLKMMISKTKTSDLFVCSLGRTAELTFQYVEDTDRVLFLDCLGATIGVGLGVALANEHTSVYAFETDGSFFYNMTVFNTLRKYSKQLSNFHPVIFDNELLESAGSMPSASVGFDWINMANAWGVDLFVASDEQSLEQCICKRQKNNTFDVLVVKVDNKGIPDMCTKDIDGIESRYRFKRYINTNIRKGIIKPCIKN